MDNAERRIFWNTLCSLEGVDIATEHSRLVKTMTIPQYIHRYRSVNANALDALRTNTLHFSTANKYDDPFDTYIHIDITKIEQEIELYLSNESAFNQMLNNAHHAFQIASGQNKIPRNFKYLSSKKVNTRLAALKRRKGLDVKGLFINSLRDMRTSINDRVWSICFSENGMNEKLWINYANNHKGFLLTYDRTNPKKTLCGKEEYCQNCPIMQTNVLIYPMYYSSEYYEPKNLPILMMFERFLKHHMDNTVFQKLTKPYSNVFWEYMRVNLIKKLEHEHDEEWRMLLHCNTSRPFLKIKPTEITLGYRISNEDRKQVILAAQEAGISDIYEVFINDTSKLDRRITYA